MKIKEKAVFLIGFIASVITVFGSLKRVNIEELFAVDWNILGWILFAVILFSIISVIITTLLMMQRHRILNIYLSYPNSNKDEVGKIKKAIKDENVISVDTLAPGTNLRSVIKDSSFCFYAVGKNRSQFQEEELKTMESLGKKIYIITMDDDGQIPQSHSNEVPLNVSDSNFYRKVEDIIMDYK